LYGFIMLFHSHIALTLLMVRNTGGVTSAFRCFPALWHKANIKINHEVVS
jgi:hypothetical protein